MNKERVSIHVPAGRAVDRVSRDVEPYPDNRWQTRNLCEQAVSSQRVPALIPGKQRILVPTDFSAASAQAVEHAAARASQDAATLTLLHVINVNPPDSTRWAGPAHTLMERLWKEAFAELGRVAWSLAGRKIEPRTIIEEGLPWEQIVEKSRDFDLIVLGKTASRKWNLFSQHTAQRVLKESSCPVVVVDGHENHLLERY